MENLDNKVCEICKSQLVSYNCRKALYLYLYFGSYILSDLLNINVLIGWAIVGVVMLLDYLTKKVAFKMVCNNADCIASVYKCKKSDMA